MTPARPDSRLLLVLPSWLGDVVMATPALGLLRQRLPGAILGGLVKPGVDELLTGADLLDELHVEARAGVMGPKRAAAKVRLRRYDAAILFTNSFSTALAVRLAGVPRRLGYSRDARRPLLTDPLPPLRLRDLPEFADAVAAGDVDPRRLAPAPAREAYLRLARAYLNQPDAPAGPLRLALTPEQERAAAAVLSRAGIEAGQPFVALNPGANHPPKRWPADRFADLARRIHEAFALPVAILGAPAERDLALEIARRAGLPKGVIAALPDLGLSIGSLKGVIRAASLLATNDTGPRHIAAAFDTPCVALFGPTDPRWTSVPAPRETIITADPALPPHMIADDHLGRCAIERIDIECVWTAVERALRDAGDSQGSR